MLTQQRVKQDDNEELTPLYGRHWINNISTVVGKNATGKTTILKLLVGALMFFMENKSIDEKGLTMQLLELF